MKKTPKKQPVAVKCMSFPEVLAEATRRAEEEERRVAVMTPDERKAYEAEQAQKAKEVEEILKQLRGPGFMEIKF